MPDPLERIIRPIVEGQIRGFLKEHPALVEAVDWFNKQDRSGRRVKTKADTFVDSLAKRINRDLLCSTSRVRLAAALLGNGASEAPPTPSDLD